MHSCFMSVSQDVFSRLIGALVPPVPDTTTAQEILDQVSAGPRDEAPPNAYVRALATIEPVDVGGRRMLHLTPKSGRKRSGSHLLYWHGGAYALPLTSGHWFIIGELLRRSGAEVWVPSYPLTPEHTVEEVLPVLDAVSAYVAEAAKGARWVVAGDSAGGSLSVIQAFRDRDAGRRAADHLVLFSPAADYRFVNPEALALESRDPMLNIRQIRAAGVAWAGERELTDPMISPLFGSFEGLPPMTIFHGDRDLLLPDTLLLAQRAREAGVDVDFVQIPGGFHVHVTAIATPEARRDLAHAARVIRGG